MLCEAPENSPNEKSILTSGKIKWRPGEQITVQCEDGYVFRSTKGQQIINLTCTADGQWTNKTRDCRKSGFNFLAILLIKTATIEYEA